MIRAGEVRNVRELKDGIQAQVCLGADTKSGVAIVTMTSSSPAVREALAALKAAIRDEAQGVMAQQLAGQARWDVDLLTSDRAQAAFRAAWAAADRAGKSGQRVQAGLRAAAEAVLGD